jgi:hypothetical protein
MSTPYVDEDQLMPIPYVGQELPPGQQNFHVGKEEIVVLSQIVTDEQVLTATTTDVLAGTQLDQPGVPGVYTIWAVSDQVDSSISITLGGRTIINAGIMVQRTGSIIQELEDPYFQMVSRGAGRPVIAVTEVTAAIMRIRTKFIPAVSS